MVNNSHNNLTDVVVVVVVIQFLSGVVPLAEMAEFTPFLLQFLALNLSTWLDSRHLHSQTKLLCLLLIKMIIKILTQYKEQMKW